MGFKEFNEKMKNNLNGKEGVLRKIAYDYHMAERKEIMEYCGIAMQKITGLLRLLIMCLRKLTGFIQCFSGNTGKEKLRTHWTICAPKA
ncbi:MAG: hypothetical protein HZB68_05840 [Candidatus Aenigmarchaeota archaeon]|nr:hypothetical protein [Candidatus Aenigmarchaeota archaeon]